MSNAVWKEFEDNALTHSAAHYLMTIKQLREEFGYARVTDVARRLNITRGSCSISLKPLKKRGLVVEDANKFLQLSEQGQRLAETVEVNDKMLERLFRDVLGADGDQAEVDACKIEHLISLETSQRLASFLQAWDQHPDAAAALRAAQARDPACNHDAAHCQVCNKVCVLDIPSPRAARRKSTP
jgi:DtxR family transcriptional regulator, Mn-dependent transcriptional regulator